MVTINPPRSPGGIDSVPMETQMNKSKIIALLFLVSITGAFNVLGETDGAYVIPTNEISKYKSWLKVTPRPHEVKLTLDGLG